MTPTLTRIESPLGPLVLIAPHPGGPVSVLEFADRPERLARALARRHPGLVPRPGPSPHEAALHAYFAGDLATIDAIPLHEGGTAFQRRVWSALRGIPPGTTCSYAALAAAIGYPAASRAVGAANGANPVSVIVPCHRLVGSGGNLTGYGGGLARKRWLLDHERRVMA